MNDMTIRSERPSPTYSGTAELTIELAKMLALVAPSTMTAEQQEMWLRAAADALDGIRVDEVRGVSAEVRRKVTRHNQIVPEIAKLVAERRESQSRASRSQIEANEWRTAIPARKHIADRERSDFKPEDWAELNDYLDRMGATARYRPDGSRFTIEAASRSD